VRAIIIVAAHSYAMCLYLSGINDPYTTSVSLLVQCYVLSRCVNADLLYTMNAVSFSKQSSRKASETGSSAVAATTAGKTELVQTDCRDIVRSERRESVR
ncbi:hypothetical protein HK100_008419, partial [Physocladia obscura]